MQLLKEITDKDIDGKGYDIKSRHFIYRQAARGVVVDDEGKFALMYQSQNGLYKNPGGGFEFDESVEDALRREVLEEAGVNVEIKNEIGLIVEIRYSPDEEVGLVHFSYCYLCQVIGEKTEPKYDKKEQSRGATIKWLSQEAAIKAVSDMSATEYVPKFIKSRESLLIKEAMKLF